jgi:hypothetical protein
MPSVPLIAKLRHAASRRPAPSSINRTSALTSSASVIASRSPAPNVGGNSARRPKGMRTRNQSGGSLIQPLTTFGVRGRVSSFTTAGGK